MADEKRLIDANALITTIQGTASEVARTSPYDPEWFTRLAQRQFEILGIIDEAPIVDAVEVVHGKMRHVFFSYQNNHYECTCCNATFLTNSAPYWNYCPNCGAKMDLED